MGAEITRVDLTRAVSAAAAAELRAALNAHGVLFFRNQALDYASHRALAELFGEIMTELPNVERAEVLEVRSRGGSREGTASTWHSDGCYMKIPPAMSILRSVTVPPLGGDTCFSSAKAAYRDLSDEMKQMIAPLRYSSSGAFMFARGSNRFFNREEMERRIAQYGTVVLRALAALEPGALAHTRAGGYQEYRGRSSNGSAYSQTKVASTPASRVDEMRQERYANRASSRRRTGDNGQRYASRTVEPLSDQPAIDGDASCSAYDDDLNDT